MRYFKLIETDRANYWAFGGDVDTKTSVYDGNSRPLLIENTTDTVEEVATNDLVAELTWNEYLGELNPTIVETIAGTRPNVIR